ncbi:GNAT acetyltransferase 2 [Carpediemonas membranifera]|uniref:GNAT acetyltransferase 2 n=1 Tax=Carpediemonas membranifera TaxID=201153 RepID=A0A8J6B4S0_9EUKA|nr:GNAT acetyltransferase 2 [Carpediemonas membranifera]|eukprot:KAG9392867.1 GNAT acetyltransferase 2 [Carpediemonas membranifera]
MARDEKRKEKGKGVSSAPLSNGYISDCIKHCIGVNYRSLFVLLGEHTIDKLGTLYETYRAHRLAKTPDYDFRPMDVLWCFKEQDPRTQKKSHGLLPSQIESVKYSKTNRILGRTYNFLVLDDPAAISPNALARVVECVSGGGVVVLLLEGMQEVGQLADVVAESTGRMTTAVEGCTAVNRFNRRLAAGLGECPVTTVVNQDWSVANQTGQASWQVPDETARQVKRAAASFELIRTEADTTTTLGQIVGLCASEDQARALQKTVPFVDPETRVGGAGRIVYLDADRGRGKSAAVGLTVAAALKAGVGFVTVAAMTPDSVQEVFRFTQRGLRALGVERGDVRVTTDNHMTTAVYVTAGVAQTVLFEPADSPIPPRTQLLVVDEAAAVPTTAMRVLLAFQGKIILSSTVNGYEGTGRALALKLRDATDGAVKVHMKAPIRYGLGDFVEAWLYKLLCLDVGAESGLKIAAPSVDSEPALFQVDLDWLFSGGCRGVLSEQVLHTVMGLLAASHYRFSPSDVQLLSDGPTQRLFVLIDYTCTPSIVCVVQVSLEGVITPAARDALYAKGQTGQGDLIPWTLTGAYGAHNNDLSAMTGARVVRVAAHPSFQGKGYGSMALRLLERHYRGQISAEGTGKRGPLRNVADLEPDSVDWLGTSFGATEPLLRFWTRAGLTPVYLSDTPSALTGEHSVVCVKQLGGSTDWVAPIRTEFVRRLAAKLATPTLSRLPLGLLRVLLDVPGCFEAETTIDMAGLAAALRPGARAASSARQTAQDIARLTAYASEVIIDPGQVMDVLPALARLTVGRQLSPLDPTDHSITEIDNIACMLITVGLQRLSLEDAALVALGDKAASIRPDERLAMLKTKLRGLVRMYAGVLGEIWGAETEKTDERRRKALQVDGEKRAPEEDESE